MWCVEVSVKESAPYYWSGVELHLRCETAIGDARRLLGRYKQVRVVDVESCTPLWSLIQGKEKDYV